jgi:hypothetical protein
MRMILTASDRKYRVLDDCARLREIATRLDSEPKLRYTPALLLVTWADIDGPDAAPDFEDMVWTNTQRVIGRRLTRNDRFESC